MSDLGVLQDTDGIRLGLDEYRVEFRDRQWQSGTESWKLERQQHFREPGFPSWEAFASGDWEGALRLMEEEREFLQDFFARARAFGMDLYRVRVVEKPVDPYLQWELHLLKIRAECGERIRVISPDRLGDTESDRPLPELVNLGPRTLYRIIYDDQGVLSGAIRYSDPIVVADAVDTMRGLHKQGEDITAYFAREIAPLPPPRGEPIGNG